MDHAQSIGDGSGGTRHLVARLLVATRELERATRAADLDRVARILDQRLEILSQLLADRGTGGDHRLTRPLGLAERRAARALTALVACRDRLSTELNEIGDEVRRQDAYLSPLDGTGFWLDRAS